MSVIWVKAEPKEAATIQYNSVLEVQWVALLAGLEGLFNLRSRTGHPAVDSELEDTLIDLVK